MILRFDNIWRVYKGIQHKYCYPSTPINVPYQAKIPYSLSSNVRFDPSKDPFTSDLSFLPRQVTFISKMTGNTEVIAQGSGIKVHLEILNVGLSIYSWSIELDEDFNIDDVSNEQKVIDMVNTASSIVEEAYTNAKEVFLRDCIKAFPKGMSILLKSDSEAVKMYKLTSLIYRSLLKDIRNIVREASIKNNGFLKSNNGLNVSRMVLESKVPILYPSGTRLERSFPVRLSITPKRINCSIDNFRYTTSPENLYIDKESWKKFLANLKSELMTSSG